MEKVVRAAQRAEVLPFSLPPVGINREQAAALIGISVALYDKCERAGTMPAPRVISGRLVYDVEEVIKAFRQIPHRTENVETVDDNEDSGNPWD
jgi:hypothetical protein